jgi:5-methylcytosine-specific restriction protein A
MAPIIRIDDEVYAWLQKQASPFEDTPNSVLRKLAGLEGPGQKERGLGMTERKGSLAGMQPAPKLSGRYLNNLWNVGARHALYNREGTWYNNLERFPGALFDPDGYVLFKTRDEYRQCSYLNIGKETNVPKGIHSIPGYVKKRP